MRRELLSAKSYKGVDALCCFDMGIYPNLLDGKTDGIDDPGRSKRIVRVNPLQYEEVQLFTRVDN
jgi:hypothetical protein